jgi:hypothetical protein
MESRSGPSIFPKNRRAEFTLWENFMFYVIRELECSSRTFSQPFVDKKIPFLIFISRPVPSIKISQFYRYSF